MTKTVYRPKTLLALLVGVVLLLALSPGPAGAATSFTVNKSRDAGDREINGVCDTSSTTGSQCTLRAAIQEANATPNSGGPDEIGFAIGGTTTIRTISPTRPLPPITEAATINGYSQGSHTVDASDDAKPNDNTFFFEGTDAEIKVQLNGTNAGAKANGLKITASNSTVKGLAINRFAQSGVLVSGSGATGNKVEGNFIGTNTSGTQDLGNAIDGVRIGGGPDNTVGGADPAQSNVVSGNGSDGVEVRGSGATGNRVARNYIGTDASGSQDVGNSSDGVHIVGAPNNTVGIREVSGTFVGARNQISGNDSDGIAIAGPGATGNHVQGNLVGTDPSTFQPLGNSGHGVRIDDASGNTVGFVLQGSTSTDNANIISFNGGDGVFVGSGTGNSILSNLIHSNGGLGIDLSGGNEDSFGVSANDVDDSGPTDDSDTGPNNLQNFPVIMEAHQSSFDGFTRARVLLKSTPNQTFTIQLFGNDQPDPSTHGEGRFLADQTTTTTDANGNAEIFFSGSAFQEGDDLTVTATSTATGDTSEFSQIVEAGSCAC